MTQVLGRTRPAVRHGGRASGPVASGIGGPNGFLDRNDRSSSHSASARKTGAAAARPRQSSGRVAIVRRSSIRAIKPWCQLTFCHRPTATRFSVHPPSNKERAVHQIITRSLLTTLVLAASLVSAQAGDDPKKESH